MAGGTLFPPPNSTSANTHLPEIRVVLLGDGMVGKTSFLRQYLDHEGPSSSSTDYEPTLLDSYTHIEYCGKNPYRVHFTDCSSAPEFREHRAAYLAKCDIVVLVFSAQQRKSLSNLRGWMKEVVAARNSTGPARFASTEGDFSEVPIFVVGTHYGEKQSTTAAQKQVLLSEAESVTMECVHSAGYFVDEEDADMEEELRMQRAASKKERKTSKKKQSPRAFHSFFTDLFKGSPSDENDDNNRHSRSSKSKASEKAAKKGAKKEEEEREHHPSSSHSRPASQSHTPYTSAAERPHGVTEPYGDGGPPSEDSPTIVVPVGASTRQPLYMLSNKDGEAVNTAVRATLAMHLWMRQLDYSEETSCEMTPLVSPRTRSSAIPMVDRTTSDGGGGGGGRSGSTPPVDLPGQSPQHGRSVSAASHTSHISERSAASFIPSMHALYGSVTSLSAFDTSYHHSRATSSGPLTDNNSPLAAGQPGQMLVDVADASPLDACSSPGLGGKTTTEPYPSPSPAVACHRGPLDGSRRCSPTAFTPRQVGSLGASVSVSVPGSPALAAGGATTVKRVSLECSPAELDVTANRVAPLQEEDHQHQQQELVQTDTAIFVSPPPNPRRPTAPNTAVKPDGADHPDDSSPSTHPCEYSVVSGAGGSDAVHPLPRWATADTPAPHHSRGSIDGTGSGAPDGVWKDVDAEEHRGDDAAAVRDRAADSGADSVVKKLALEHEGRSTAASTTPSPQKPPERLASGTPTSRSPGDAVPATAAPHAHHRNPTSGESSSVTTLRSLTVSPQSRELSHTQSRTASHASTPKPRAVSRSQTRTPPHEEDDVAKSSFLSASDSHSHALSRSDGHQKQKASQCTSDGCSLM